MPRTEEKCWLEIWNRVHPVGGYGLYARIVKNYNDPNRKYHTLLHIEHCLTEFDQVRDLAEDPDAVELALWLHDFVYDPKARDNEEKSARFAESTLRYIYARDSLADHVAELILATKHTEAPAGHDARLLVDIDLSILGQSEERFDEYERQIREEYSWVSDQNFVAGRSKILQSFLDRLPIYSTQFFRNKYEEQARSNLKRSIARLSQ